MATENTYTLIRCGKLYDGIHEELFENREILVKGKYIEAVGENLACPEGAGIIDLGNLTVTPGLTDAHIHSGNLDTVKRGPSLMSEGYMTISHVHTAQRSLERGFTTIRCLANNKGFGMVDARNVVNDGYFPGARMIVGSQMMGSLGGHADMSVFSGLLNDPVLSELAVNRNVIGSGADFFRGAVQKQLKFGVDFIKVMYSGGFMTPQDDPLDAQLNEAEMRAIIDTAHEMHSTVTAHVYGAGNVKRLLSCGIDGMEHCALLDEEACRMLEQQTDCYVVNTMHAYEGILNMDESRLANLPSEFARRKLMKYAPMLRETVEIFKSCRIPRLGLGSDIGGGLQRYDSWAEVAAWMKFGMGGFRTLHAATMGNASVFGMEDLIGSIEPGKYADIAGWHRDILNDPEAVSQCDFVMKEGVRYNTVYAK